MAYSSETVLVLSSYWNNIDSVMTAWQQATTDLENIKAHEARLRRAVYEVKFPNPKEGTNRVPLSNGWNLKAVAKTNYTFVKDLDTVEAAQKLIAASGNEGPFIAERLIKWTPELVTSEYKKLLEDKALSEKYRKLIDDVLITKPGMPQLELEPPKEKK